MGKELDLVHLECAELLLLPLLLTALLALFEVGPLFRELRLALLLVLLLLLRCRVMEVMVAEVVKSSRVDD